MQARSGQPWVITNGELGKLRDTGICILLSVVTLDIYGLYWLYATHSEMKRHTGQGFGGVAAVLLSCIPLVMAFRTPGELYTRQNRQVPVSSMTGWWSFLPIAGGLVWFVKTNGALNEYWTAMGAPRQA